MTSVLANATSRALHGGGSVVQQVRSTLSPSSVQPAGAGAPASGWLVVSVFREPSEIDIAELPAPLAELGERIEVRVHAAPGGKGAELAARLREQAPRSTALKRLSGNDPESDLRSALRRAKQLIEVGEVLAVDPAPHGERTATPGGVLLESWTKVAHKSGVR
jgi:hypothetical protein